MAEPPIQVDVLTVTPSKISPTWADWFRQFVGSGGVGNPSTLAFIFAGVFSAPITSTQKWYFGSARTTATMEIFCAHCFSTTTVTLYKNGVSAATLALSAGEFYKESVISIAFLASANGAPADYASFGVSGSAQDVIVNVTFTT